MAQAKKYIPILIPPFDYRTMQQGVIPASKKAYMIDDLQGLTAIKEAIELNLNIQSILNTIWNDYLEDYSVLVKGLITEKQGRKKMNNSEFLEAIRER